MRKTKQKNSFVLSMLHLTASTYSLRYRENLWMGFLALFGHSPLCSLCSACTMCSWVSESLLDKDIESYRLFSEEATDSSSPWCAVHFLSIIYFFTFFPFYSKPMFSLKCCASPTTSGKASLSSHFSHSAILISHTLSAFINGSFLLSTGM